MGDGARGGTSTFNTDILIEGENAVGDIAQVLDVHIQDERLSDGDVGDEVAAVVGNLEACSHLLDFLGADRERLQALRSHEPD